ncbi:hypothetical protein NYG88_05675 [Campylobacter felis]|uniref:hypothetical protein n=1 Tax=Campylobacter felis TaxID=2974565 RepID=UPI002566E217|nr:hypothetical protein [Campylobacter felis]
MAASVFAASAEKKKYDAYAYYDSVEALCEAMRGEDLTHKQILAKSLEKIRILGTNRQEMEELIGEVESIMRDKGVSISIWNKIEQRVLKTLMQLAEVVVTTINAPIMNDEDELTKRLREHQKKCENLMKEIQRKWGE